jgi:hypothetical protein
MKFTHILAVSGIVILLCIVAVSGTMIIPMSENGTEHTKAPEHSPVFTDKDIGRIDFIHYAKPTGAVKPPKTTTCYKLMGISWKSLPADYVINPVTGDRLDEEFVCDAISASAETWDDATSRELFADTYTIDDTAHYGSRDGLNVIDFYPYGDPNVIAVTSVFYFRPTREIVEFDIRFNEVWMWGKAEDSGDQMDVQNIATHEMGHAVGLADLYTDSCREVTMFGYSAYDETKKRDLEPQDIIGIQKIYGP